MLTWRIHWKQLGPDGLTVWGGISANHQGRERSVSRVHGDLRFGNYLCLPSGWKKHSIKEQSACQYFQSQERAALNFVPPALALKVVDSVSLCTSPALFELLLLNWSPEWVSLWVNKFMLGLLRRHTWNSRSPPSHSDSYSTSFYSHMSWGLFFPSLYPKLWSPCGSGNPWSLGCGGNLYNQNISSLSPHHGCGTFLFSLSTYPTSLIMAYSIYS